MTDNYDALLANFRLDYVPELQGNVSLLQPDDLLPPTRALYDAKIKELNVPAIPIILDGNLPETASVLFEPRRIFEGTEAPDSVFLKVSEYSHRWTIENVKRNSVTDEDLAKREPITNEALLAANIGISRKLGLTPPAKLYYSNENDDSEDYASITAQGTKFIVLKKSDSLTDQLATLPHEVAHHAFGHTSFETQMRQHNAPSEEARRAEERLADSAVIAMCQGRVFAASFANDIEAYRAKAASESKLFDAAYQLVQDHIHPPMTERVAEILLATEQLEALKRCPVPPSLPSVTGGQQVEQHGAPSVGGNKPATSTQR